MFEYFNLLVSDSHGGTMLLYTCIFFIACILGSKVQHVTSNGLHKFSMKTYICLYCFLCAFYVFNDVGIDTEHYRSYYRHFVTTQDIVDNYGAVEKLYQYLNVFLHIFITNEYIGVGFIRMLQLAIFFIAIYKLRNRINIGFAIMAYMAFFYYDSFNLLRSSLAGSICILGMAFLYDKKYLLALLLSLLAYGFHHSAIFFIAAVLVYLFCYHTPAKKFKKVIPFVAVIGLFVVLNYGADIINQMLVADFANGRYDYVVGTKGSSMGLFVLLKYSIPFYVLYMIKKDKKQRADDVATWEIDLIWTILGFAIALLAYQIGMLARVAIYFSSAFIILLPRYIYSHELLINTRTTKIIYILYFILMFVITIGGLYEISGLGPFKFV